MAFVSYDNVPALAKFARRRNVDLTLLSDSGAAIIKAFDVLNKRFKPGAPGYGIAHPIIFIADAKGIITHRFSESSYTSRPGTELVRDAIGG